MPEKSANFFSRIKERGNQFGHVRYRMSDTRHWHAVIGRAEPDWRFARATVLYENLKPRQVSATDAFRFMRSSHQVQSLFKSLLEEWRRDTLMVSDEVAVLMHPAHFKIIGLGLQVLPCIFRDLGAGGGPWFVALEAITQDRSIATKSGNDANALRKNWLEWGRKHGYAGS